MATTTNYGWTTPDDTALVKDGAAAIRTLGSSIDTTTFNNASAAIAKATVDAKGDLIAGTADNTVARLAVGTNGQVLTADSTAATGLAYTTITAGGMTLLSTTTLSGASTTISGIDQTHKHLMIVGKNIYVSSTGQMQLEINADTGNDYALTNINGDGTTAATSANENVGGVFVLGYVGTDNTYSKTGNFDMTIPRYSETEYHPFNTDFVGYATSLTKWLYYTQRNRYNDTAAITSLKFINTAGTFSGGTIYIYGVK